MVMLMIHPCATGDVMRLLAGRRASDDDSTGVEGTGHDVTPHDHFSYLVRWFFAIVAPVIGLSVSSKMMGTVASMPT